ncbi:MAG: hypothetical protein QXG39_02840 [Candidatus Aenigmatarchaeota archaeon]
MFEKFFETKTIVAPKFLNLDELCFLFLASNFKEPVKIQFSESPKQAPFYIGFSSALSSQKLPPGQSISKLFVREILKRPDDFKIPVSKNLMLLIEYCTKVAKRQFSPNDTRPGSLAHVVYSLRSSDLPPEKLFEIFSQIALKILEEPDFLNTMCDLLLESLSPEYAKVFHELDSFRSKILTRNIRFIYCKNFFIAINQTDYNVSKQIFTSVPFVGLYIFKSPVSQMAGVIVHKKYSGQVPMKEIYNKIKESEKNKVEWLKKGNSIITNYEFNSDVRTSLECEDLMNIVLDVLELAD